MTSRSSSGVRECSRAPPFVVKENRMKNADDCLLRLLDVLELGE